MRPLLCLLLLALPAWAQEEHGSDEPAESMRPGSDSPEAVLPRRYEGPRRRAQAFLIPMDEGARATVLFLISHHLRMSQVAFRRDTEDSVTTR